MKTITILPVLAVLLAISASAKTQTTPEAQHRFEKANELLKRMDYEGAITEYSKVIELSPGSKIAQDAQYWIGQSQFRSGNFDAAQATFAKLIETYPTSAIIPVTKLMVGRVEQAKKTEMIRAAMSDTAAEGYIIDPDTGVRYTKAATFAGKNDVIKRNILDLSPNGKFLLYEGIVVPMDGSEHFDLVDNSASGGVWSPDGTKVAFYSEGAICIVPVSPQTGRATGPVRKLLEKGEDRYGTGGLVSWSPAGEKLAFGRYDKEEQVVNIWTLSVIDGSLTQFTTDWALGRPKWSPDSKTILYSINEGGGARSNLCMVTADGKASRKIVATLGSANLRTRVRDWYWSPDGEWIIYRAGQRIHLLNLSDNQELETKPPSSEIGEFFSWSPDGRKMLFYRESYDWRYEIRVVSALGGPSVGLRGPTKSWPEHQWSADSKTVLAAGYKDGRYGIWISPLTGGNPVLLEVDVSVGGKPLFFEVSPTGDKLAFVVDREEGTRDLYVVPVSLKDAHSTGPAVKVFEGWHPRYASDLTYEEASWSPDGSKLAVVHGKDLWIAFSNGDKPMPLVRGIGAFYPGWSPDGTMVDYMAWSKQDPEGGLYVVPSGGGEPIKIEAAWNDSVWSPDSKKLAVVSKDRDSISIVSVADGHSQEIARLKDVGFDRVDLPDWSPDGKYVACAARDRNQTRNAIVVIPVEGGKSTILDDDEDGWKTWLQWSPDGKWISYRSGSQVKVRPEGTLWEVDFEEIVKSASRQSKTDAK